MTLSLKLPLEFAAPMKRTANIFVPVKRDDGLELFEVECGMNTLNQSVTWAQIKTGPKLTDDDVKYLRAHGLCSQL